MPRYDYRCPTCGHREEVERPMSEASAPPPTCPSCLERFGLPALMLRVWTPFYTQPSRVQQ